MSSAEVQRPTSALLRGLLSVADWSLYAVAFVAPAIKADDQTAAMRLLRMSACSWRMIGGNGGPLTAAVSHPGS